MRYSNKAIGAAAAVSFLLIGAGQPTPRSGVLAQEIPQNLQKPLQYEVSVVLKMIQVYVTDKKGNPVQDLGKNDFIIHDNGRPIEITEFETHVIAPAGPASKTARADVPLKTDIQPVQAGSGSPAHGPAMTRKFVLLFDFAFNNLRGVRKAKEAARHFLDEDVRPGDEISLLSYSLTRGLSIHEFMTADQDKVRQALELLDVDRIAGRAENIEQEYWLAGYEGATAVDPTTILPPGHEDMKTAQPPNIRNPANLQWRRQESKHQALNFVQKLTTLAQALRYVPGQKQLILFSSGIAGSLMYATQEGQESKSRLDLGDFVLREAYEGMLKTLSSVNCQVFTFDTREAALVPSLFDYEDQTFGLTRGAGRFMFTESGVSQNPNLFFTDDKMTGMYALTKLSKDTGGVYYSNINEYDRNLGQLQSMTGAFYVLGYPVNETYDGRFHEIKVEVKRKDVKVNAQRGFFNPVPFDQLTPLEKEFSLFDLALSDQPVFQVPLAADMTALAAPFGPDMNLSYITRIPSETMARLAGPKVEIVSIAFDEGENLVDLRRAVYDLTKFGGQPVIYASGGSVKPGSYRCRVIVRNLDSGQAAVASSRVFAPPPQTPGIRLHSLLLLQPGSDAAYLEGTNQAGRRASEPSSSWASLYAFNRSLFTPALGPIAPNTSRIYGALPCSVLEIPEPLIGLRAFLINMRTGEKTPVPITLRDRMLMGDTFVQSIEIGLDGSSPGSYVLYLYAEEKTTKAIAHITAELTLR